MKLVAATVGRLIMQSETDGALPILFAATQDLDGASYVGPAGVASSAAVPHSCGESATAQDPSLAAELWDLSERLTGTVFPLG